MYAFNKWEEENYEPWWNQYSIYEDETIPTMNGHYTKHKFQARLLLSWIRKNLDKP